MPNRKAANKLLQFIVNRDVRYVAQSFHSLSLLCHRQKRKEQQFFKHHRSLKLHVAPHWAFSFHRVIIIRTFRNRLWKSEKLKMWKLMIVQRASNKVELEKTMLMTSEGLVRIRHLIYTSHDFVATLNESKLYKSLFFFSDRCVGARSHEQI